MHIRSTPTTPEPRVLLVSGSPRRGGNTDTVLSLFAAAFAQRDVPTDSVRLCDIELHPCTGCEGCRRGGTCTRFRDGMTELYPRVERAQGLVIASPTYHYTVTPEIKAFIDRLYPYYDFQEPRPGPYRARLAGQGRAVVPVGICEQNDPADMRYTIPVMRDALEAIGYEPMAEVAITGHFYRATVGDDATVAMMVRDAADRMTERLAG